jgi:hypothetical protein
VAQIIAATRNHSQRESLSHAEMMAIIERGCQLSQKVDATAGVVCGRRRGQDAIRAVDNGSGLFVSAGLNMPRKCRFEYADGSEPAPLNRLRKLCGMRTAVGCTALTELSCSQMGRNAGWHTASATAGA